MAVKTIAGLIDAISLRSPSRIALISPFQSQSFTYSEIRQSTNALAGWLKSTGYQKNDLLISDLPNISENLILQVACNRIGVAYSTAKDIESMAKYTNVKGVVGATDSGFLANANLEVPCFGAEYLLDLIHNGGLDEFHQQEQHDTEDELLTHAFYNSTTPYTNQQALKQGEEAAYQLSICEDDVICVSITLCHAFGFGSAVCSALQRGATIVLPAVGGIQGCGVPSKRAPATLEVLKSEGCTIMFADTHTLKALPDPDPQHDLRLRAGVCKIGSGSTFLEETRKYGEVNLRTIGKQ